MYMNVSKFIVAASITAVLIPAISFADSGASMHRQLRQGMSGDDVRVMQAILAADPSVYPEASITGTYGPKTAKAVAKFQKKYGMAPVGSVGPKTLQKMQEFLRENDLAFATSSLASSTIGGQGSTTTPGGMPQLCHRVPPGHTVAPGWMRKNGGPAVVPPCQDLPPGILGIRGGDWNDRDHFSSSTQPNRDREREGDRDEREHDRWTPPATTTAQDTTAPVVSGVAVSAVATTTATISWATNEPATSLVYWGTSTPVSVLNATLSGNNTLVTSHVVTLNALSASTTYYYLVKSIDPFGNQGSSSQGSFMTTK